MSRLKVKESAFLKEAIRFIGYGSQFGWHERNAGNLSLLLIEDELNLVRDDFSFENEWIKLSIPVLELANEFVFTTVSGSYFIDIHNDSENKFCICQISEDGTAYRIVWGVEKPTSELCGHLMSLESLKKRNGGRAIYHCHPSNVVALSYIIPQTDKDISNALWESETECAFVFPKGIGVVGFCVPGSIELAKLTSAKINDYDAVLWSCHGVFATGDSIATAFGLVHAIEKAAEIRMKILSTGKEIFCAITKEQQRMCAETYGFKLNEFK